MQIEPNDRYLDRETVPVEALCRRCGSELYDPAAVKKNRGLCADCAAARAEEQAGGAYR